jgi:hypothetical protein
MSECIVAVNSTTLPEWIIEFPAKRGRDEFRETHFANIPAVADLLSPSPLTRDETGSGLQWWATVALPRWEALAKGHSRCRRLANIIIAVRGRREPLPMMTGIGSGMISVVTSTFNCPSPGMTDLSDCTGKTNGALPVVRVPKASTVTIFALATAGMHSIVPGPEVDVNCSCGMPKA